MSTDLAAAQAAYDARLCPECGSDALVCVSAYDNPAYWCGNCGTVVDEMTGEAIVPESLVAIRDALAEAVERWSDPPRWLVPAGELQPKSVDETLGVITFRGKGPEAKPPAWVEKARDALAKARGR